MGNKLNVLEYNASLQELALLFHSGNSYLDSFLRSEYALDKNIGKTFVFLSDENDTIIGYYNIGTGDVEYDDSGIRKKMGGSIHINCFALDEKYHGILQAKTEEGEIINLSDVLLMDCMDKIQELRNNYVEFAFITLNSTEEGYSLYKRNDFEKLEEDMSFSKEDSELKCIPMYYAIDII